MEPGVATPVLLGMENYQDLRRTVAREQLGSFGPVKLTSSALVKRLVQGGVPPLQQLFVLLSHWVAQRLTPTVVARLYARRWDIELAFLTLKDYLNLHHWWSSKLVLVLQQIWAVLIIAHLLQSLRLEIAAQAGVDPFDVSLPLLVKYVPRWILRKQSLIDEVLTHGRDLGFIRPSSRLQGAGPLHSR